MTEMAGFDIGRRVVTGVAVDTPNPRERDDAFDLTQHSDGSYVLTVSIVDVAALVAQGSEEDRQASNLGISRYMSSDDRSMFPASFVERYLTLLPGVERLTVSIEITLSPSCEVLNTDIFRSRLRIREAMEFDDVDAIIAQADHPDRTWWLMCLHVAGQLIAQYQNPLDGDMSSQGFMAEELDLRHVSSSSAGAKIVGAFMLISNYLITSFARRERVSFLYRNFHPEYFEPVETQITWSPWGDLDINQHAHYGRHVIGHTALGFPHYGHWSSPCRRFPDLVDWRMLHAHLDGQEPPYTDAELDSLGVKLSILTRRYGRGSGKGRLSDVTAEGIKDLSKKGFSMYIWLLTEARIALPSSVCDAVIKRLRSRAYTNLDIARILSWKYVSDIKWRRIKYAAVQLLLQNHSDALAIYRLGVDHNDWPHLERVMWEENEDCVRCSVEHGGQVYQSVLFERGVGNLKIARQRALLALMLQFGGQILDQTPLWQTTMSSRTRLANRCIEHEFGEPMYLLTSCTERYGGNIDSYTCLGIIDVGQRLLFVQTELCEPYYDAIERCAGVLSDILRDHLRRSR